MANTLTAIANANERIKTATKLSDKISSSNNPSVIKLYSILPLIINKTNNKWQHNSRIE